MPAVRSSVAVAEGNAGRYSVDAHLTHVPAATEAVAETHVRRLEAMRRAGLAIREPDGSWSIAADHLDQVSRYEAGRAREAPVRVELLSSRPIEQLVGADAVTWLDRELVADTSEPRSEEHTSELQSLMRISSAIFCL